MKTTVFNWILKINLFIIFINVLLIALPVYAIMFLAISGLVQYISSFFLLTVGERFNQNIKLFHRIHISLSTVVVIYLLSTIKYYGLGHEYALITAFFICIVLGITFMILLLKIKESFHFDTV